MNLLDHSPQKRAAVNTSMLARSLLPHPVSFCVGDSAHCSATYKQLGLLTYFTSGEKETRAWTIKEGFTAPQAAGVIHTGGDHASKAGRVDSA